MALLKRLLDAHGPAASQKKADAAKLAEQLTHALKVLVTPSSFAAQEGVVAAVGRRDGERKLVAIARDAGSLAGFTGKKLSLAIDGEKVSAVIGAPDHANALAVRKTFDFARPRVVGIRKSFGFGDRLGLATPGHIAAVRGTSMVPFFAQQSIREMTRSGRTAEIVMDDATWSILEEGWRDLHGSDADHLKTPEDADVCLGAGFTLFTVDPGSHVDGAADTDGSGALVEKFSALPWPELETTPADLRRRLLSSPVKLSAKLTVTFTEETLRRAAAKYARAVLHTVKMYRHLASKCAPGEFELEVSVDETDTPTSVAEHYYIASELARLGVKWSSLAPRFVGRFEKGVDYIGDLREFERAFAGHVEIAKAVGPYKLSLHSGSDKFSIYPVAAKLAGDLIHVKTAGTSYLEALRVVATLDPALFREIFEFAVARYETDKATYHVSADLAKVPRPSALKDKDLPAALDRFDDRQVLHVTYGSVLMTNDAKGNPLFRERLLKTLRENPEAYLKMLKKHFAKHVGPFA